MSDNTFSYNNNNSNSLMIPQGFSITTVDGQEITLAAGHVADFLPGGGSSKPLPRLAVGQPNDSRFPEGSNQLFLIASEQAINDNGEKERIKTFVGPFGDKVIVRPVGYTLNRSFMPKFDPRQQQSGEAIKPLCHSESFIAPDAQYAGKYSTRCAALDPQSGRLVQVCPMARWGNKDPRTGKSVPPMCAETYIVAVAFSFEDQWIVAETYFKASSASAGKTLVQMLRGLEHRGTPVYQYPVELTVKPAGAGNTFVGRMLIPAMHEQTDRYLPAADEEPLLQEAVEHWQKALRVRAERANRVEGGNPAEVPATSAPPASPASTPTAPNGGGKGNGKKAMI